MEDNNLNGQPPISDEEYVYDKEGIDRVIAQFKNDNGKKDKKKDKGNNNYDYNEGKERKFSLKSFLIVFFIIIVLAVAGFCIYYFAFREENETPSNVLSNNETLGTVRVMEYQGSGNKVATAIPNGVSQFIGWTKGSMYDSTIISEAPSLTIDIDDTSTYYAIFNMEVEPSFTYRGIEYWLYEDAKRAVVIGNSFTDAILDIPRVISLTDGNYQVYKISMQSFVDNDYITDIRLSRDIIEIESEAFVRCSNISNIVIDPQNLYYTSPSNDFIIENSTNKLILGLSTVIPENVTSIAPSAFNSADITEMFIPEGITEIPYRLFYENNNIELVTIPSSVTEIGESAFANCANLTTVVLNEGLQTINERAFAQTNVNSITIPSTVKTIKDEAFLECDNLTSVEFAQNSTLETVGQRVFVRTAFSSITIPASIETMGNYLVSNNSNLKTVIFEDNSQIQNIDRQFANVANIESIDFGDNNSLSTIADYAFADYGSLTNVDFGQNSSLYRLGEECFRGCGITSIVLPATLAEVGTNTFLNCNALTAITFEDGSRLDTVTSGMFSYITSLQSIDFGDNSSVIEIRESAFEGLSNLLEVDFGQNSILSNIYESAFSGTSITSITIPASVGYIGQNAFACDYLVYATFESEKGYDIYQRVDGELVKATTIEPSSFADTSAMANNLKNTYCNYVWMIAS